MSNARQAGIDQDLRDIIDLMVEYRSHLPPWMYPDPDPGFALENLRDAYDEGQLVYVLEERAGKPAGCIVGCIFEAYWSPGHLIVSDMIFYVTPEYRGLLGVRLLEDFEKLCRERGVATIEMNNVSPEHMEGVANLYLRRGYRQSCITYEKDLTDGMQKKDQESV